MLEESDIDRQALLNCLHTVPCTESVLCKIDIFELSFWHPQAGFNSQKLDDWLKLEIVVLRLFCRNRGDCIKVGGCILSHRHFLNGSPFMTPHVS